MDLVKPDELDMPAQEGPKEGYRAFLSIVAAFVLVAATLIGTLGYLSGSGRRDHFSQIGLDGDLNYFMTYAHLLTREMQDRDVIYHGFGRSIDHAKDADIIILGHSVLQFGIVGGLVDEFAKRHGVKIYNLTNPGIASGTYVRKLIEKWKISPKIWIINADDKPEPFFDPALIDSFGSGRNSIHAVMQSNRLRGFLNVTSRNFRWRLETAFATLAPDWLLQPPYRISRNAPASWRNIATGNYYVDRTHGYLGTAGPLEVSVDQHCATSSKEIAWAQDYLSSIKATTILTLVPYDKWCPLRVKQLAEALGVEYFYPLDPAPYSTFDGRHMNRDGSIAYTKFFLSQLEKSRAFQILKGEKNPGPPLSVDDPNASARNEPADWPIKVCVTNTTETRIFVSVRSDPAVKDYALMPGEQIKTEGVSNGKACSSHEAFNRDQCPNEVSLRTLKCK